MNIQMGSHTFSDVTVPVLWGERAILQDKRGRISVVELSGPQARLEIVGDKPAKGARFTPTVDGFIILASNRRELYAFSPTEKRLTGLDLRLPDIQIAAHQIRVGTNTFSASFVAGFGVGIAVSEDSIALGAPLPDGLAPLVIPA